MTVGLAGVPDRPAAAARRSTPEDLAAYAYEVMDLKRPALEWNPHLASTDDATLVNLPTWLWTRDPAAVEERQVTAEAAGVSVTVTAQPNGMTVTSPVGGTECSAEQARTAYAPGVDEASACVFTFAAGVRSPTPVGSRSSRPPAGRRPGRATPDPAATSSRRPMAATTNIPVIEVQSRVEQHLLSDRPVGPTLPRTGLTRARYASADR